MASFLQKNDPWIESTISFAASFDSASFCGGDDDDDDDKEDAKEDEKEEEPQTENTIPSGLLPSPPKQHGSNKRSSTPPPSRRGKIVQVIQRGGNFDWQSRQPRRGNDNGNGGHSCPPYLVIHDGQYSTIAFLSPETLERLSSSFSYTIVSNRSLVCITNYTVSTILQCCQREKEQQHHLPEGRQPQEPQQSKAIVTSSTLYDFELHSQILNHLYFTTRGSNNNNHHHNHDPIRYTLIPPEIQSQLPYQITNNELYLCLYIQGDITMIGAENQGLIGNPKDVHCSPKLRREIIKHEQLYDKKGEEVAVMKEGSCRIEGVEGDDDASYSHNVLIKKLEAVNCYYSTLARKKNLSNEVVIVDEEEEEEEDEVEEGDNDDDDDDDEEWEEEHQRGPSRGFGSVSRNVLGGRTKKGYGRRGKKRQTDDRNRRTATTSQRMQRATTSTKSMRTEVIPGRPWELRSAASLIAPAPAAADTSTNDADDSDGYESEIVSAMLMMRNPLPGKDDDISAVDYAGERRRGVNGVESQTVPSVPLGGGIPNRAAATPPNATASSPQPCMGSVQELFELGVDIEAFLSLESQSDSDDNAELALAAGGSDDDHRNIHHEGRCIEENETYREPEAPVDKIADPHEPPDVQVNRQQSPRREREFGSTQETGHEASFVGINDMLVDEGDEDNGDDEPTEENSFKGGGGNYNDIDEPEILLQTQPESTANYHTARTHANIGAREMVEVLESQIPLSMTRNAVNQQQLADEQHRSPQFSKCTEVVVSKRSSRRNPSRKKKFRRWKEMDEEEDYSIPISQRKPPPETLEGYMIMESQIPLPPPRRAWNQPVAHAVAEEDDDKEKEKDNEEEEEEEEEVVGRQSQIPISTKPMRVNDQTKRPNTSTATKTRQPKSTTRKDTHNSDDNSSDGNWMRVRKSKKLCDDDDSDDWMKVRKTTKQAKRHSNTDANDDNFADGGIVFDDAVDDDATNENYEPTFESQMAGEGSEEIVPPSSPSIKSVSSMNASGKRAAGNRQHQRNHVRFVKNPSKEGNYGVDAFSSKASVMLGFTSAKKNVERKNGRKKSRGEQFDVASFVDKAQRLCGL